MKHTYIGMMQLVIFLAAIFTILSVKSCKPLGNGFLLDQLSNTQDKIVAMKDIGMLAAQAVSYVFIIMTVNIAGRQFKHQQKVDEVMGIDRTLELLDRHLDKLDEKREQIDKEVLTADLLAGPLGAKHQLKFSVDNRSQIDALETVMDRCWLELPNLKTDIALLFKARLDSMKTRLENHRKYIDLL